MDVVDEEGTSDREREEQEEEVLDSSAELVSVESCSQPATPSHHPAWHTPQSGMLKQTYYLTKFIITLFVYTSGQN